MTAREPAWCPATLLIADDKWGSYTRYCDGYAGHDGPHWSRSSACDPPAALVWPWGPQ
ncbi:MAG TPA: hypothetical protein VF288_10695 [Mycobacteriales bacterium]